MNKNFKILLLLLISILGFLLVWIFNFGLSSQDIQKNLELENKNFKNLNSPVLFTEPDLSQTPTISPTQSIKIYFAQPLENVPETKVKIDPEFKNFELKLSEDHKTLTIIPTKPYDFGSGYTLYILANTKLVGGTILGQDLIFHFKTIEYRGP